MYKTCNRSLEKTVTNSSLLYMSFDHIYLEVFWVKYFKVILQFIQKMNNGNF